MCLIWMIDKTQAGPIDQMWERFQKMDSEVQKKLDYVKEIGVPLIRREPDSQTLTPKKPTAILLPETKTARIFNRINFISHLGYAFWRRPKIFFQMGRAVGAGWSWQEHRCAGICREHDEQEQVGCHALDPRKDMRIVEIELHRYLSEAQLAWSQSATPILRRKP
jgi:hypothetical protein